VGVAEQSLRPEPEETTDQREAASYRTWIPAHACGCWPRSLGCLWKHRLLGTRGSSRLLRAPLQREQVRVCVLTGPTEESVHIGGISETLLQIPILLSLTSGIPPSNSFL